MSSTRAREFANKLNARQIEKLAIACVNAAKITGVRTNEKITLETIATCLNEVLSWRSRL